ncbi:unnamed protein product, partial [Mesorhabditis spiculigera]
MSNLTTCFQVHTPFSIWNPPPGARKYGLLFFWRILAFKHLIIASLIIGVGLLGGLIFYHIEHYSEIENVAETTASLEAQMQQIAEQLVNQNNITTQAEMEDFIRNAYILLQRNEGVWKQSTFYKNATEDNLTWLYWPSVNYAVQMYMTTGYGTITVNTTRGRIFTIIWAFIMIPFLMVLCRDLGQWWLVCMTKIYARILLRYRKARGIPINPKEEITLPLIIIVIYTWLNILFCGLLTWAYDAAWGAAWGEPGNHKPMGYWDACYFVYVTVSAMGMSDDVPRNSTTAAVPMIWYVLSLPLFQMGIRVMMIYQENAILGSIMAWEWQLAKWDGYFKTPAIDAPQPTGYYREVQQDDDDALGIITGHADPYAGEFGRVRLRRSAAQH